MTQEPEQRFDELRQQAEKLLDGGEAAEGDPEAHDLLTLIHELHVHQVELKIQNDELRRAQSELVALHQEFVELYDFAPCGYVTLDAKGLISRINLTGVGLLGVERSRLVSASLGSLLAPSSQSAYYGALSRAGATGEVQSLEVELPGGSDGRRWARADIEAVRGPDDVVLEWRLVLVETTAERRSERERERLAAAVEQASELIVITDPDGTVEYVNPSYERITGRARAQAAGSLLQLFDEGGRPSSELQKLWATLAEGLSWRGRLTAQGSKGTARLLEGTISPIRDGYGSITNHVAVLRDITRQAQLEGHFRQAQKMESIGRLAGGIAHDFNNMLQVITGNLDLAIDALPDDALAREPLREIEQASEHAIALVAKLLSFSRRQVVSKTHLDLNQVCQNLMGMVRRLIGEPLHVDFVPGPDLKPIHADRVLLEQLLLNLSINARDAMPHGGRLTIETSNVSLDAAFCDSHAWAVPGEFVRLRVRDQGGGMDPETLKRAFEPFFTTKAIGRGTGLGLATVYGTVKSHDGLIDARSELGRGTTIDIYLPQSVRLSGRAEVQSSQGVPGGRETVLLAEDTELVRRLARHILERAGYSVLEAEDGQQALDVYARHRRVIDILLLDIRMPRLSGLDVWRRIDALEPGIPTILTTGYSEELLPEGFGADTKTPHIVRKPFRRETLLKQLREVLDRAARPPRR